MTSKQMNPSSDHWRRPYGHQHVCLEISASLACNFRGIGIRACFVKERWSGCEGISFLLSSLPELKYLSPKLRIQTKSGQISGDL